MTTEQKFLAIQSICRKVCIIYNERTGWRLVTGDKDNRYRWDGFRWIEIEFDREGKYWKDKK